MKKIWVKTFVLSGIVIGVTSAYADNVTTDTSAPASQTPPKHHHRRKKKTPPESKAISQTPSKTNPDVHTGIPASNTDAPGMSNSLGSNNAGSPNMGTADHTPGTTGTSGQ